MRTSTLALPLAIALLMAGCTTTGGKDMLAADAPRALPESGPVGVHWNDPATFTELRHSRNRWDAEPCLRLLPRPGRHDAAPEAGGWQRDWPLPFPGWPALRGMVLVPQRRLPTATLG